MKKILVAIFIFLSVFSIAQEKKFKVVLDAGHGGKDPGAAKNGCIEKLIALDVVLRIGKILESYPDFNIKSQLKLSGKNLNNHSRSATTTITDGSKTITTSILL
jgi:hypothetical protein